MIGRVPGRVQHTKGRAGVRRQLVAVRERGKCNAPALATLVCARIGRSVAELPAVVTPVAALRWR